MGHFGLQNPDPALPWQHCYRPHHDLLIPPLLEPAMVMGWQVGLGVSGFSGFWNYIPSLGYGLAGLTTLELRFNP